MKIEKEDLERILISHNKWFIGIPDGVKADLSWLDLSDVDLSFKNLFKANLSNTILGNLSYSNLTGADLTNSNLLKADVTCAELCGANLIGAKYEVSTLLKAWWSIPHEYDYLILELMAHDAEVCGIVKMDLWARDKITCPFEDCDKKRPFNFKENKTLWYFASDENKRPKLRGYELLQELCKACGVKL